MRKIRERAKVTGEYESVAKSKGCESRENRLDERPWESGEKLRIMFESIRDGITVTDLNGRILDMNEAAVRLHGFKDKHDVLGINGLDLVAERNRSIAIENMNRVIRGERGEAIEYTLLDREGREFIAEWTGAPMRDVTGNICGFIGISRDVTQRKHMEQRLAVISELIKIINSSLNIGDVFGAFAEKMRSLVEFDRMTIILVQNERLRYYLVASEFDTSISPEGVDIPIEGSVTEWAIQNRNTNIEDDLLKIKMFPIDHCHLHHGLRSAIRVPLFSKGEVIGVFELTNKRPGTYSKREQEILEQIAAPLAAAIVNSRLFTQVTKQKEELEKAYDDLKTAQEHMMQSARLRALGEMASGVAHDFNNTLAIILGRVHLALMDVVSEKPERNLKIVERIVEDAAKTVRRLQDFARVRVDHVREAVDVNELVTGALHMVESRLLEIKELQGITIDIALDLNEAPPVEGDASELREALVNIIFNAIDAMPQGGKITIQSKQEEDQILLSIGDTGVGISDDIKGRIFDPFFTTKGRKGSGLGLSVTYGIITRHRGTIDFQSREGQGATFYIKLPIGVGLVEKEIMTPKITAVRSATILVADDNTEVGDVLGLTLQNMGHRVKIVNSGSEAVDAFRNDGYDLVITDLGMPDMSGREVARAVKQAKPDTPVLLITGWGVQLDLNVIPEIDSIITKPFSEEALTLKIGELLDTKN